jgi:hypothetical protein
MSKDSEQPTKPANEKDIGALRAKMQGSLQLGHLGTLNQVTKALGKVIRAMADGSYDSQVGARICNGLGIMRACLETATLERIEERLAQLEGPPSYGSTPRDNQTHRTH